MNCSNCEALMAKGAKFCPDCGFKAPEAVKTKPKPTCPACNSHYAKSAKFCPDCGADVSNKRTAKSKETDSMPKNADSKLESNSSQRALFFSVVGIVLVGFVVYASSIGGNGSLTSSSNSSLVSPSRQTDSSTSESSSSQSSESNSSSASGGSALADCQAYQSGYNSIRFSEFLETEWKAFKAGGATKFKSQEFLELWTRVQNENFPTWDDVGYVIYELCWDAANFEITIPAVEASAEPAPQQPSAPSVEYVEMPNLIGAAVGEVRNWLSRNGYKFTLDIREQSTNPSQACVISGRAPVTSQQPAPGSVVENVSSVRVTIYRNCPTPTNPFPLPDSHTG